MGNESNVVTLVKTDAVSLRFYPKKKIVHHEFRQFVHGDQLREVLTKGLEILEKRAADKWLSDDRGNGALTQADTEWALKEWTPRVMAAGWKHWAVVMPAKVIGKMNMNRWMRTYAEQGVITQAFGEPVAAMKWLERQSRPGEPASALVRPGLAREARASSR